MTHWPAPPVPIVRSANYNVIIGETDKDVQDQLAWIRADLANHHGRSEAARLVGRAELATRTRTSPRAGAWALGLAVTLTAGTVAACGSSTGPLSQDMISGQPNVGMSSSVVSPGEPADGEAFFFNSASDPVQITDVLPVSLPGEPAAQLAHVGIQATGRGIAAVRGWPPPVPIRPAVGGMLPHGYNGIIFGVTGQRIGRNYVLAGLRVDYTYRGQSYSAVAYDGEAACVAVNSDVNDPSCNAFFNKSNDILQKLAGLSRPGNR